MDYFVNGTNYKISYTNFIGGLGVTGSITQTGAATGIAVLDIDGSVNKIRNIENGPGVLSSVSAENGLKLQHNFSADSTGAPGSCGARMRCCRARLLVKLLWRWLQRVLRLLRLLRLLQLLRCMLGLLLLLNHRVLLVRKLLLLLLRRRL